MSVRRTLVAGFAVVIGLTASACAVQTDLGRECTLVKRDAADTNAADGVASVPLKERDIAGKANSDLISFGSTECEDLICVRDLNVPRTGDPEAFLTGYCSRVCIPGSRSPCPMENSADEKDANKKLNCRALLLDQATLAGICEADPATCKQFFADNRTSYFCARGSGQVTQ